MPWITQQLFLKLLLLPAAAVAFAHSSLLAIELFHNRRLVPKHHAFAWNLLTTWHALLPLAGIFCIGYLVVAEDDEWLRFGSAAPTEVMLILLSCLAVGVGKSTHMQPTTIRTPVFWHVLGFHLAAVPAAILTSVFMSWTVTGLFSIETTVASQFITGSPPGIQWQERQRAWTNILWTAVPAVGMSVVIWTTIISHRRTSERLYHCVIVFVMASLTSIALTYAIQEGPIPVLSKDLMAGVVQFPTRLLTTGGPILLLASGIVAQRLSMSGIAFGLPVSRLTKARRSLIVLTCVGALVTLNWIPVLRSLPWPPPSSIRRW